MANAAFNAFDFDSIRAISDAAAAANERVFLQFSSSTVSYYGADTLAELVAAASKSNRDYLIVHLDHCTDFTIFESCVNSGWDSIMADFSHLPLPDNIRNMKKVRSMVAGKNVLVEGELGQVAGVEDGHGEEGGSFVCLDDVQQFVSETKVDLLAVGIGNAHGVYETTDKIDIDLLREVHVRVPSQKLVLHGGTGIESDKIRRIINYGVEKINISTELKQSYIDATAEFLAGSKQMNMIELVDHRYRAVRSLAEKRIRQFK